MKNLTDLDPLAERPNLDFSKGILGKYNNRFARNSNIAILDADLVEAFPDSASANAALRIIKEVAMRTGKRATRTRTKAA